MEKRPVPVAMVAALVIGVLSLSVLTVGGTAAAADAVLLAEVPDFSYASTGYNAAPCVAMTFSIGSHPDVEVGYDAVFYSGDVGFVDYDASNSAGFAGLVGLLTDGVDDMLWVGDISLDVNGDRTVPTEWSGGDESGILGVSPDLVGATIDFIRLTVYNVNVWTTEPDTFGNTVNHAEWGVVWQFWGGAPVLAGGGQAAEADLLLTYANPLETRSTLPAGATSAPVRITYGPTIDATTFEAKLKGRPFAGFAPAPGKTETVVVPVSPGHNALVLNVGGTKPNGKGARDQDRLTFIVPR